EVERPGELERHRQLRLRRAITSEPASSAGLTAGVAGARTLRAGVEIKTALHSGRWNRDPPCIRCRAGPALWTRRPREPHVTATQELTRYQMYVDGRWTD